MNKDDIAILITIFWLSGLNIVSLYFNGDKFDKKMRTQLIIITALLLLAGFILTNIKVIK